MLCLLSALRFHALTMQQSSDVWLAIPQKGQDTAVRLSTATGGRMSGPAMTGGVEIIDLASAQLRVFQRGEDGRGLFQVPQQDRPRCRPRSPARYLERQAGDDGRTVALRRNLQGGQCHTSVLGSSGGGMKTANRGASVCARLLNCGRADPIDFSLLDRIVDAAPRLSTDRHHSFQPYEPNVGMAARRAAFDNGVNGLQIHVYPSINVSRCALPASGRLIWRRLALQMREHLAGLCSADTERQFAFR
jgi:hypothetical protein